MRSGSLSRALALLVTAPAALWLGCGGGGDITNPPVGTLEVTTTTSGPEPDADGYAVSVDGAAAAAIGSNATVRTEGLAVGPHTVELTGVAPNCIVDGDNPRAVTVTASAAASVTIAVSCTRPTPPPAPGSISVTTRTVGADPDPDGYAVSLDGGDGVPIGLEGTLPLPDLAPGPHSVGLTGISANCRLDGDNPLTVTVAPGTVASVVFSITCEALPPATGTVEITTATTGPNPDPDGYTVAIDGGDPQAIGVNDKVSVASLTAGTHAIRLGGAAANCAIAGSNPRNVTVTAGGTTQVAFTVTCATATGAIRVTTATTGSPGDPDGYTAAVDGGTSQVVTDGAGVTFEGLEPRAHSVLLGGLAANCQAQGENPRTVTVAAGETVDAAFAVTCTATTGSLTITITGLPAGTDAAVTVTGPNGFSLQIPATRTLADLIPGEYTVAAAEVTSGATRYTTSPASRAVTVSAAATATVTVTYGPAAGPSLNLRVDGWQLTQSVQSPAGDVPLVGDRDGFLRVFVVANEPNTAAPDVRVRIFQNGTLARTLTIRAPGPSTPIGRNEADLGSSWNVKISRDLLGPGLAVLADVDPANAIPEQNESDNNSPASGTPAAQTVRGVPNLGVRFVPVKQRVGGQTGSVSDATRNQYLSLTRRIFPVARADGDVHAVYTTATSDPLQPDDANGAWVTILSEIDALRVAEGTARNYYGVVRIDYPSGIAGLGYLGLPTAMGYDREDDRSRVMAHELGHNWNRLHAPCGRPAGVDPDYPYPSGAIGVYGFDLQDEVLKDPSLPDIMGYCGNPWISDYTYEAVLAYRRGAAAAAAAAAGEQRCLLVWGRIVDGRPVLEPAFEIVTRPSMPKAGGPYSLEGLADDGARLFNFSFDAAQVADDRRGSRHFAFAVPLGEAAAARLGSLRAGAPGGETAAGRSAAPLAAARAADVVDARATAGGVALRWDASAHPMLMVRDPATGEVLSFARGGEVEVATTRAELDVVVSDRVGSRQMRVAVRR